MEAIKPADERQLHEALAEALAGEIPVEVVGLGTKRNLGRPVKAERLLDLSRLAGVDLYEPHELVMTARAGTPLADIEAMLDENRQQLMFEPPDFSALLGGDGPGTIGGVFAANLAGPRRLTAGAARDHILGFRAYSGRAEAFKSGGRVVKNVTGFDLSKLMAGSFGTLAALTEVSFKVMPRPEETRTVLALGLGDGEAVKVLTLAMQSSHEVSGAAHLPAAVAAQSPVRATGAVTAVRVEGPEPSVAHRSAALRRLLSPFAETAVLEAEASRDLWRAVRDVAPLLGGATTVWRLSVAPASAPAVIADLATRMPFTHFVDRAGGLVWVATQVGEDGGAEEVRAAVGAVRGIATLVRAPAAMRAQVPVFHPQPKPLQSLSARIKEAFDPRHILNPGRMFPSV